MSLNRKLLVLLIAIVALAVIAIWATTPRSYGHDDDGRIDTWDTQPMPRKTWENTSNLIAERSHRVTRWKTQPMSRQQLRTSRGSCGYKTRAHVRLIGGNAVIPNVVTAHATITWCGWGDDITSRPVVNTWGDARMLWEYEGVIDTVKGSGRSGGMEYAYRRIYFKWTRGFQGVGQSTTAWIAMTVRGDLSCTADKYHVGGTEAC